MTGCKQCHVTLIIINKDNIFSSEVYALTLFMALIVLRQKRIHASVEEQYG